MKSTLFFARPLSSIILPLLSVLWISGSVYVCGTHYSDTLEIQGSGFLDADVERRITIDGTCPGGQKGTIIGSKGVNEEIVWHEVTDHPGLYVSDQGTYDSFPAENGRVPGWVILVPLDQSKPVNQSNVKFVENIFYTEWAEAGAVSGTAWWEPEPDVPARGGYRPGRMVMYFSEGEPGDNYKKIIIPNKNAGIRGINKSYVDLTEITLKYIMDEGARMTSSDHSNMSYMTVSYFGGGMSAIDNNEDNVPDIVRAGNGLMFDGDGSAVNSITHSHVSQGFDVGLDMEIFSSRTAETADDITFANNHVEYCGGGISIAAHAAQNSSVKNITVRDNTFYKLGYGWSGPANPYYPDADNSVHGKGVGVKEYARDIVINGSFAGGYDDWSYDAVTGAEVFFDTSESKHNAGSLPNSLRMSVDPAYSYSQDMIYQEHGINPSCDILEGFIKTGNIDSAFIRVKDMDGNILADTDIVGSNEDWQRVSILVDKELLIDNEIDRIRIVLVANGDGINQGEAWFDHIKYTCHTELDEIHIIDNVIDGYTWAGVLMWSGNVEVSGNIIRNGSLAYEDFYENKFGKELYSDPSGIIVHGLDYEGNDVSAQEAVALIENNTIHDNEGHGIFVINNTPEVQEGIVEIRDSTFCNNGYDGPLYSDIEFAASIAPVESNNVVNCAGIPACTDNDGDGYYAEGLPCWPFDCDDSDANIHANGLPVRVVGVTTDYFHTIQAAYDAAADDDMIQCKEVVIEEDVNIDQIKSVSIHGGYDCGFSNITGATEINGNMNISDGSVDVEGLTIK